MQPSTYTRAPWEKGGAVTDLRFDALTKAVGQATSRRSVLKALAAGALGGALARVDRRSAAAATKRPACSRLHQACSATSPCCPGGNDGTCNGGTCCVASNAKCINDSDCCAETDVCRKKTTTSLRYCLPPAVVLQPCDTTSDCAGGLTCDPAGAVCLGNTGTPCDSDADCLSGICDEYAGVCTDCHPDGDACTDDSECCGFCDEYTGLCMSACLPLGTPCAESSDCCDGNCDPIAGCCNVDGSFCTGNSECCSGICDSYTSLCIAACLPAGAPCSLGDPGDCCSQCCTANGAGPGIPGCCGV